MKEEWRDIRDYEGFYQVSNLGRVRSLDREVLHDAKKGFLRKIKGKILSTNKTNGVGYKIVSLTKNGKKNARNKLIHRLVAQEFIPNPEKFSIVNHLDGNPTNCRVDNLEWTNHQGNMSHAVEKGLINKGEKHKNHKLTKKQVNEIYRAEGYQREIAEKYGVSQTQVWAIKSRLRRSEDLEDETI